MARQKKTTIKTKKRRVQKPSGSSAAIKKAVPVKPESNGKSLESWIWDAACSIRGAKDAPKYKDFILPLIFAKRLCDVFDDELNRIAKEVGSRAKAFKLVKLTGNRRRKRSDSWSGSTFRWNRQIPMTPSGR